MSYKFVLGDGLIGHIAASLKPDATQVRSEVKSSTITPRHEYITSNYCNHIVKNESIGGLSKFYHGLTPLRVLSCPKYCDALAFLNVRPISEADLSCETEEHWFVLPHNVPRPTVRQTSGSSTLKIYRNLIDKEDTVLALSCLGNLEYLQSKSFVAQEVEVDDDLVLYLGTVTSLEDLEYLPIKINKHLIFPNYRYCDHTIYFRPVFYKDTKVNFTNIYQNLLNISEISEKVLRMLFARYGKQFVDLKKYEVVVQFKVKNAYILSKGIGLRANNSRLSEYIARAKKLATAFLEVHQLNLEEYPDDRIFSGIHLSYDRSQLQNVPSNFRVLDTSLAANLGEHNTIESACNAFNMLR